MPTVDKVTQKSSKMDVLIKIVFLSIIFVLTSRLTHAKVFMSHFHGPCRFAMVKTMKKIVY